MQDKVKRWKELNLYKKGKLEEQDAKDVGYGKQEQGFAHLIPGKLQQMRHQKK